MQTLKQPLVSIIIPVFNRGQVIGATIRSVISQTYQHWECIIIDDFSEDQSVEEVRKLVVTDQRFQILKNERSKGAPGARNTGVQRSSGEYLIFLDSDDLLTANSLELRVKKFSENINCDFLVFSTVEFKNQGDDTNVLINVNSKADTIERFLNLDIPWLIMGPIWKKASFLSVGPWNENTLSWQDWEFHIKALHQNLKYKYFGIVDNYYRCNPALSSIGNVAITVKYISSHLVLLSSLKSMLKEHPAYLSRINGLLYWFAEKALQEGDNALAKKAMLLSHEDLHFSKKLINLLSLKFANKFVIRHPRMPDFGTYRKFLYQS